MRIVAIGIGGAGCRIADSLYSTDRRSSKVACVQGLAVDISESTLQHLSGLPDSAKIFFPAMDPEISSRDSGAEPTATIDISEIISRIHNFESGETDAILICVGLGGSMADIAPHIITGLRSSIVEPIFGLVTLPCLAEGEKHSAKAADDIDILAPLLDGMILFDNETWYKKTKTLMATLAKKEKTFAHRLGFGKTERELSPELATYQLLNEAIVRRISLILRAGEFKADGGIDLAEVVLDSGEVLNTMKGMGFITIGYAVERLPANPLGFLSQFRPQGLFNDESKKKASRIVELAKQAIYHEISTPCDMTSAHKALVLIAGPSHELSMKGFMTVRKWIDRSIAGLETRSGDYPVMNTKNVAIIIMLSGLENIPRISELREIREQYSAGLLRRRKDQKSPGSGHESLHDLSERELPVSPKQKTLKDEMIVLPIKMKKERGASFRAPEGTNSGTPDLQIPKPAQEYRKSDYHDGGHEDTVLPDTSHHEEQGVLQPRSAATTVPVHETPLPSPRHRVVVTKEKTTLSQPPFNHYAQKHQIDEPAPRKTGDVEIPDTSTSEGSRKDEANHPTHATKDVARQRIELALQKQRINAISGREKRTGDEIPVSPPITHDTIRKKQDIRIKSVLIHNTPVSSGETRHPKESEQTTVIVPRKKRVIHPEENPVSDIQEVEEAPADTTPTPPPVSAERSPDTSPDEMTIALKDIPFRAKDKIFDGKTVQRAKTTVARDSSLIHTSLKPKKNIQDEKGLHEDPDESDSLPSSGHSGKKTDKKGKNPEDLSWI
jgi:cell division GTPase FtsZ